MQFAPGEAFDHTARRRADAQGNHTNALTGYGEGRIQLSVPFNDHIALLAIGGARYEGGGDRTFDWRLAIMRDAGVLFRSNTTLVYHDRRFGALGPQLEVLNYALNGERNTSVNLGFTYVGRLGLRKRYDLLYLTVLMGLTGSVNGVPAREVYGDHYLRLPITVQLAYRVVWELWSPKRAGSDD
jgi:hypothetical protein